MLPVLLLLFIAVPIAELALIIEVGQAIGVGWTLGLLLADALLGSILARSQGRAAWRRLAEATREGRPPAREVLDGALVLLGGALLLTPGFITDVVGLALLLPPTRAVARRLLARRMLAAMTASMSASGRRGPRRRHDVDGTAVEMDSPRLPT